MRNLKLVILLILALVAVGIGTLKLLSPEDTWIKDKSGVWVKHGKPWSTPAEVLSQQESIRVARDIFQEKLKSGVDMSPGPCLSNNLAPDWVLDVAHSPREETDNRPENQCQAFNQGKAHHFIELDPKGNIIKIY